MGEKAIRTNVEKELEEKMKKYEEEVAQMKALLSAQAAEKEPTPPKVSVYTQTRDGQTDAEKEEMTSAATQLVKFLEINKIPKDDIKCLDVTNDFELAGFIKEALGPDTKYPLVAIHGKPIGDLAALKGVVEKGHLQTYLDGNIPEDDSVKAGTGQYYGQGILDRGLDAAEYIVSTVSSIVFLPVTLITWPFRSSGPKQVPKGEKDVDVDMIHTNWYWRNQRRKFRFFDSYFVRLHPAHMDIRAIHQYETIASITFRNDSEIVIRYNDDSSPDYLTGLAEDCQRIRDLIVSRSKTEVYVNYGEAMAVSPPQ